MDILEGEGIWVHLDEVTEAPGPCTMSYAFKLDTLCESIRNAGLVNPPLVCRNEKGGFDIVAGYRRILALKALGKSKALCRDVTTVLSSPQERFFMNFYENLATRKFNDIEKAMILYKLQRYVTRQEILASFMPLLHLPSHEYTLEFYLKLFDMDDAVQNSIANEEISLKTAKALLELDNDSRRALFRWISTIKVNFNQQLQLIEYTEDISIKEGVSISALLSQNPFIEILDHSQWNAPQKAKKALELLRARRHPRLVLAQEKVEHSISGLPLPPGLTIRYDPYFEDSYYRLELRFRDGKDLRKTIGALQDLDKLESIPEPWAGQ